MLPSLRQIPRLLLVLLQICCISQLVLAAGPPAKPTPPKPAAKTLNKSTPGAGGSGWYPPPNNPFDRQDGKGKGKGKAQPPPPPPLPAWRQGDVIGARAKYYEPNSKVTTMHPGIVVGGPDPTGYFRVAMISNKLPGNPPKQPVSKYTGANGGVEGDISLWIPVTIHRDHLRPWRRKGLGDTPPLPPAKLVELKRDINAATSNRARLARRALERNLVRRALRASRLARREFRANPY